MHIPIMFFLNVDGQIVRVKGYGFIDSNMMLDAQKIIGRLYWLTIQDPHILIRINRVIIITYERSQMRLVFERGQNSLK